MTDRQTDTSTDNKGCLKLAAREPTKNVNNQKFLADSQSGA